MEFDLNWEPLDQIEEHNRHFGAVDLNREPLDEIEEHSRHLEAVIFRGMERQNLQQEEVVGIEVKDGKMSKSKSSNLIGKAMGMETHTKEEEIGSSFNCNICLDMARDPVVTFCGHLFCWPCFYKLPYAYANAKECPVCKGEVKNTTIIPIYGTARVNSNGESELKENGLEVPPRPPALRIESSRQQFRYWGGSPTIRDL